jgi:hypothetical protein
MLTATGPTDDNPRVNFLTTLMTRDAHNSVAAATWPWRDRETKKADTAARRRRHRILLQSAVGLSAGAVMLLMHWNRMGTIAVCIASAIFVVGRIVPRFYDAIDGSIMFVANVFGRLLTWILLVPFFYLCFLPGRIILLAKRKDPMSRKCPSNEATFWVTRSARHPDHFTRQY